MDPFIDETGLRVIILTWPLGKKVVVDGGATAMATILIVPLQKPKDFLVAL